MYFLLSHGAGFQFPRTGDVVRPQFCTCFSPLQPCGDVPDDLVHTNRPRCAFPDNKHTPTRITDGCNGTVVPITVGVYLGPPEFGSGLRNPEIFAICMSMPEAPMHENNAPEFRQNDVGFSRKARHMQPEPETRRMKPTSQDHFRLCIRRPDAGHHLGSCERLPLFSQGVPFLTAGQPCWPARATLPPQSRPTPVRLRRCRTVDTPGCH